VPLTKDDIIYFETICKQTAGWIDVEPGHPILSEGVPRVQVRVLNQQTGRDEGPAKLPYGGKNYWVYQVAGRDLYIIYPIDGKDGAFVCCAAWLPGGGITP